ncbi:MAG: citrate/2-methylcitrate synthase [Bacillota bacterium]|nr:citrate/2-methylcitrate synthase [Bacillota bacterium]
MGISKTLSHAAITTFLGPLHGGSIEQTMKMLREVETPEHVHFRSYIRMVCKCS